ARTGLGVSWKLSGGNIWSLSVTKVSKKRQVRRAVSRNDATVDAETRSSAACARGRLIHHATAGPASHNSAKGKTSGQEAGSTSRTPAIMTRARQTPCHIER